MSTQLANFLPVNESMWRTYVKYAGTDTSQKTTFKNQQTTSLITLSLNSVSAKDEPKERRDHKMCRHKGDAITRAMSIGRGTTVISTTVTRLFQERCRHKGEEPQMSPHHAQHNDNVSITKKMTLQEAWPCKAQR